MALVRHANSAWNATYELAKQQHQKGEIDDSQYESEKRRVYSDLSLCDCPLSSAGITQCSQAEVLPTQVVLVSPMRRCLETAYRLFKDSDEFEQTRFIVHPLLIEQLHCACDVPSHIEETMKLFSDKFPQLESHVKSRHYFAD